MSLPSFKYHPHPILSGSIVEAGNRCKCCDQARGYIYAGPVYSEAHRPRRRVFKRSRDTPSHSTVASPLCACSLGDDLDDGVCPWCIADGTAHHLFDATFVDEEAIPSEVPEAVAAEIAERTPGFNTWRNGQWFFCCDDAMAFLEPVGIVEIRARHRPLEFTILGNIIYDLHISGGAANRALESLKRDIGPTAYIFQCLHCDQVKTFVDGIGSVR